MPVIRVTICPCGDNGLELEAQEAYATRTKITRSGSTLSLPLEPVHACAAARRMEVKLMPRGQSMLCRHEGRLTIRRAALAPGGTAADTTQDNAHYDADELILDHLEARVSHPDHCQWERTYLAGSPDGAAPPRRLGYEVYAHDTLSGGINETPKAPEDTIFAISQLAIAPGELAMSMWRTVDGRGVLDTPAAAAWFRTCCLTGGSLTAVHGVAGQSEVSYTVRCQGVDVPCRATDNTAYVVGEWVCVLDTGASCRACDRTVRCRAETAETPPPSAGIILPVRILDHTLMGARGEYALEFQSEDLSRLLGLCLETGQVLAVDMEMDRADIHVDGADRVPAVPVHYRCTPDGSVAGGSTAFLPEDIVLMLRVNHTLERVVVGFADGVRPCQARRSTVLCFLVEKFSCLYGDLAIAGGLMDEDYGWIPSGWSTHISRGQHIDDDPAMDTYIAAYCAPAYSACYEKVYVRVWDDGSVEEIADPEAANLEIADCFTATRWRKLIAQSDGAHCPALPEYTNRMAVGHELVAPTHQENVLLPDGSRLALAKTMAGFAAVLVPPATRDDPDPAALFAYAVHDPHELHEKCVMVSEGYTETRETCRYRMPPWYTAVTGLEWGSYCACTGPVPCRNILDDFSSEPGDHVAMYSCPWFPELQFGTGPAYTQWYMAHTTCDQLWSRSGTFREHCGCVDAIAGEDTCDTVSQGVQTIYIPPQYTRVGSHVAAGQRDVIEYEAQFAATNFTEPLSIAKPLPGAFSLAAGQDADGGYSLQARGGWTVEYDSGSGYTDEAMAEVALGCDVQWTPANPERPGDAPSLQLTPVADAETPAEWDEPYPDELTTRLVDNLGHLVVETTYRKPAETEMLGGVHPVALLARGRVWAMDMEDEAAPLDVAGILDIIAAHAGTQGYDCAVLRPWCCLRRPS